ncbi:MAG: FAD-dependent oxidoreductase, partial [Sciscionella sp.]
SRLGAEVDLLVAEDRPLAKLEDFVGEFVAQGLLEDGVRLRTGARASRVAKRGEGFELELADGGSVSGDELLLATGRKPATSGFGLGRLGVSEGGALQVDDTGMAIGVDGEWLYACGDVTGRAPLTHQGKYAARLTGDAIVARAGGKHLQPSAWDRYSATADHRAVPQVIFTDPEVASVGLTSAAAAHARLGHRVVDVDIAVAGSALQADGYQGRARMVVDTEREVLLGVTFVGQDVAEMLHSATIAIVGEVPLSRLWHAVPAYPTISEVWLRLLESYGL